MWTPIEDQAQAIESTRETASEPWSNTWLTAQDVRVWR